MTPNIRLQSSDTFQSDTSRLPLSLFVIEKSTSGTMDLSFWAHSPLFWSNPSIGTNMNAFFAHLFHSVCLHHYLRWSLLSSSIWTRQRVNLIIKSWLTSYTTMIRSSFSSISNKAFSPVPPWTSSSIIAIEPSLSLFDWAKNQIAERLRGFFLASDFTSPSVVWSFIHSVCPLPVVAASRKEMQRIFTQSIQFIEKNDDGKTRSILSTHLTRVESLIIEFCVVEQSLCIGHYPRFTKDTLLNIDHDDFASRHFIGRRISIGDE